MFSSIPLPPLGLVGNDKPPRGEEKEKEFTALITNPRLSLGKPPLYPGGERAGVRGGVKKSDSKFNEINP